MAYTPKAPLNLTFEQWRERYPDAKRIPLREFITSYTDNEQFRRTLMYGHYFILAEVLEIKDNKFSIYAAEYDDEGDLDSTWSWTECYFYEYDTNDEGEEKQEDTAVYPEAGDNIIITSCYLTSNELNNNNSTENFSEDFIVNEYIIVDSKDSKDSEDSEDYDDYDESMDDYYSNIQLRL